MSNGFAASVIGGTEQREGVEGQFTIRIDDNLYDQLKKQAKKKGRSLNRDVEARLLHEREMGEIKPLFDELRDELRRLLTEAKGR